MALAYEPIPVSVLKDTIVSSDEQVRRKAFFASKLIKIHSDKTWLIGAHLWKSEKHWAYKRERIVNLQGIPLLQHR